MYHEWLLKVLMFTFVGFFPSVLPFHSYIDSNNDSQKANFKVLITTL